MIVEIGKQIKIEIPTDNSKMGKAVIYGKFRKILKLLIQFDEEYKEVDKLLNNQNG